jgi:hypothetical protein
MPLPEEHARPLLEDLQIHERRLAFLEDQIRLLSSEVNYHRQLLALGRDPRLLRILSAVLDDRELATAAREDPSAFLEREGVSLPGGVTVDLTLEPQTSRVQRVSVALGGPPGLYGLEWTPNGGFVCTSPLEVSEQGSAGGS